MIQPAQAYSVGAIPLLNGQSLSFNGLQFTVNNCGMVLGGALSTPLGACSQKNLEIVGIAGPGSNIRIQGENGTDIFSYAGGTGLYDVVFDLAITPLYPQTTVNQVSMAIVGSVSGGASNSRVSAGATLSGTDTPIANKTVNLSSTTASWAFSSVSSLNESKDLKVNTIGQPPGSFLTLSYVTQGFLPAPEPVSMSVFAVGLAGLGAALRLRSRKTRHPK